MNLLKYILYILITNFGWITCKKLNFEDYKIRIFLLEFQKYKVLITYELFI